VCRNPNKPSPRSHSRQWFPGELPHWPAYDTTSQRYIKFGQYYVVVARWYVVTLRRARLILGWVTVYVRVRPSWYNHSHLCQLSLSPFRGRQINTGERWGYRRENHLCQVAGNTVWSHTTSDLTSALEVC